MTFSIFFKGSTVPDRECDTLNEATAHMEGNALTGIVIIRYPESRVEVIWYNKGKRK